MMLDWPTLLAIFGVFALFVVAIFFAGWYARRTSAKLEAELKEDNE